MTLIIINGIVVNQTMIYQSRVSLSEEVVRLPEAEIILECDLGKRVKQLQYCLQMAWLLSEFKDQWV